MVGETPRTVLVAVSDPRIRQHIRSLLEERSDFAYEDGCADGVAAQDRIEHCGPDLVLLEIQLAEVDGFEVVRRVGPEDMPVVVFLTSLDRPVLSALEVHALDYLLMPFDDERLHGALDSSKRYRDRFAAEGLARRLRRLVEGDDEGSRRRRIPLRNAGRLHHVALDDVRWVEGVGSFARLHLYDGRTHLLRETLDALGERFADDFVRVHRSTLVRTSEVAEILSSGDGEARVRMRDGSELFVDGVLRERLTPLPGSSEEGNAGG